jgi:hypothetical protein
MMPPPGTRWHHTDLALCGALAGTVLALVLNVLSILSGRFDASDPFMHLIGQAITCAGAGAILSFVLGLIYRRFRQRV